MCILTQPRLIGNNNNVCRPIKIVGLVKCIFNSDFYISFNNQMRCIRKKLLIIIIIKHIWLSAKILCSRKNTFKPHNSRYRLIVFKLPTRVRSCVYTTYNIIIIHKVFDIRFSRFAESPDVCVVFYSFAHHLPVSLSLSLSLSVSLSLYLFLSFTLSLSLSHTIISSLLNSTVSGRTTNVLGARFIFVFKEQHRWGYSR